MKEPKSEAANQELDNELTIEISDGGPLMNNLKPQRNPAVRCIDLLCPTF